MTGLMKACFVCIVVWGAGFYWFIDKIPSMVDDRASPVDAIVVLTGGSDRIREGIRLLYGRFGKRLFISGVGERITVMELFAQNRVSESASAALASYTALGYAANSTQSNAREVAQWMTENGFRSMRLVTSNYHMLRSLLEFHKAMPGMTIITHPVFPEHVRVGEWWRSPGTVLLLATEYNKFLAVASRDVMLRMMAEAAYWLNKVF